MLIEPQQVAHIGGTWCAANAPAKVLPAGFQLAVSIKNLVAADALTRPPIGVLVVGASRLTGIRGIGSRGIPRLCGLGFTRGGNALHDAANSRRAFAPTILTRQPRGDLGITGVSQQMRLIGTSNLSA